MKAKDPKISAFTTVPRPALKHQVNWQSLELGKQYTKQIYMLFADACATKLHVPPALPHVRLEF